jgi:hypothetical protein
VEWLSRTGKQYYAYLAVSALFALFGVGFVLDSGTGVDAGGQVARGVVCFAIAGVCIAHWAHPRMWSWLGVFAPCFVLACMLGWTAAVGFLAHPRTPHVPASSAGDPVVPVAVIALTLWLWLHRPSGVSAVGGPARTA